MGSWLKIGGAGEIRTRDPLLAKQVLCQLSYDPIRGREKWIYKERAEKNLLCAINWNPETFVSFDHRLGGLLRSAVSLERR